MLPSSDIDGETAIESTPPKKRKWLRRLAFFLLGLVIGVGLLGWFSREDIARDLIGDELAKLNLPATYDIADISTDRQILTNIVVGDPSSPDLTIERVEAELVYGLGAPVLGRITIIRPRLYGRFVDGQISFGALDPVLFAESDEPAGLPDIDIALVDARGLLETEFGPIGWKAEGEGLLSDGFAGILAATAPNVRFANCSSSGATLYGQVATDVGALSLDGPLRLQDASCPESQIRFNTAEAALELVVDRSFSKVEVAASVRTDNFSIADVAGREVSGPVNLAATVDTMTASFDLEASQLKAQQVGADQFRLDGILRVSDGYQLADMQVDVALAGIEASSGFSQVIQSYSLAASGTLAEPLLKKLDAAQRNQLSGASFAASLTARSDDGAMSVVVPQGALRNAAGGSILSLSRVEYRQAGSNQPRMSGNFRMGGGGLPAIAGRMEQRGNQNALFRLKMQRYASGENWLELPELLVEQRRNDVRFDGSVIANGNLPGGTTRNLIVPVKGTWQQKSGLSLWSSCTSVKFDSLSFANLDLASRGLTLCPPPGGAIVRQNDQGLKIAAGTSSLQLDGTLADTEITINSGPLGVAYPGLAKAQDVEVVLGANNEANRFVLSDVTAAFADTVTGSFNGADIKLFAVPIDMTDTSGEWTFNDGVLTVFDAAFIVSDRSEFARFAPLSVNGASLKLAENIITADAILRHPDSQREVSTVDIQHDLGSAAGFANLRVDQLVFDEALQPDELTDLALGVVANAEGVITGNGRIDWGVDDISSSGKFSSESLNFAAVFGPVQGARGTVEFVDLLSLTTAPDQQIQIESINPGIEARDGVIGFSLSDGQFLGVTGGSWPFMGGTLTLRPTNLNFSVAETRRYVLAVEGLDSALFIENMEIGNLAASGVFDGELPIVFDELGFGEIQGGVLRSRGGGNVSYVGELTYEDLSPMANYAFTTLRSLDYTDMQINIDGPLTGDVLTKLSFGGVKQGAETKQNFITRQIADLPIRFNVNIRAPFYKLVDVMKSIYDPATVTDPRDLGLFTDDGTRFLPAQQPAPGPLPEGPTPSPTLPPIPAPSRPDESAIHTLDSEDQL